MADVRDIVTAALREIGVLADGEVPTASAGQDGLDALNRLQDKWAAERLEIYTTTRVTWTLTQASSFTVGSGATVNVARPVFIEHVNFIDTAPDPDFEMPLHKFTEDEYAAIPQKTRTSRYPEGWYYNPTYPTGTLSLWPIPTASGLQGVLYAPAAIAEWTSLSTAVSLPPGYREMLVTALAVRLAPSYGRQVVPELLDAARDAKATVKRANVRFNEMSFDPGALIQGSSRGAFNIRTGE